MYPAVVIGLLLSVLSLNSFGNPNIIFDDYRRELKAMAKLNHAPNHSYKQARKYIMQKIHLRKDKRGYFIEDVYCKIEYRKKVGPRKMPNHQNLNVEHTWPRSRFGSKPRKGLAKSSKFRTQEADLHHLFPSDSKTNSRRANFIFSQFTGDSWQLTNCPTSKVGYVGSIGADAFEPPVSHKGNVARALFYFAVRYDLKISAHEEFFLRTWNILDPVDREEILRNDMVENIQGNRNPFVDDPEFVDLLSDF